ncbi:glutaredoxin-1 [Rissa tridactyla]|uniref:glutaredoxin-1 n=1 Tax=Rissa tridactyla TaxID=75485 RepID=UPI0023BA83A2|nr:glutaredoxin-1 [Rissa tridactyla]
MATYVKSRIRDDKVTIFKKNGCPYCRNALELLKYVCAPECLQEFDITGLEDVQDYLQQTTRQRTVTVVKGASQGTSTGRKIADGQGCEAGGGQKARKRVPCVFIGKQCIGGLSELERMSCKLPAMLQRIGARK